MCGTLALKYITKIVTSIYMYLMGNNLTTILNINILQDYFAVYGGSNEKKSNIFRNVSEHFRKHLAYPLD